ncbi:hypothetical protein [Streptomyces bobili]|uniref:hypothetical protein n=1 Tax=Streptomyces bobili TaxID=67280 RepID=UPI00117E56DF|nr:hypothetical protein [Streptomyces bobili]
MCAALAALVLAPVGVAAAPSAVVPDVVVTEGGLRLALVSCALRNTGTGWSVISDAGHQPSGCEAVVTYADHLELQHDVGAVKVSSLSVTVDETYAKSGLRVGASVGFDHSNIYLHSGAAGSAPLNPATVSASSGNLWVQGWLILPAA